MYIRTVIEAVSYGIFRTLLIIRGSTIVVQPTLDDRTILFLWEGGYTTCVISTIVVGCLRVSTCILQLSLINSISIQFKIKIFSPLQYYYRKSVETYQCIFNDEFLKKIFVIVIFLFEEIFTQDLSFVHS